MPPTTLPTLLVVASANETHRLSPFLPLRDTHRILILHDRLEPLKSDAHKAFGQVVFWQDYPTAQALLEQTQPKKIIWYLIESYIDMALRVAAQQAQVPCLHLEHGLRQAELSRQILAANPHLSAPPPSFVSRLRGFSLGRLNRRRWQGRFLKGTLRGLASEPRGFLHQYLEVRRQNGIAETFRLVKSNQRAADAYISFSPKIFEYHQQIDHLAPGHPVHFIGNPGFDAYRLPPQGAPVPNAELWAVAPVVLIDQPLAKGGFFGWNRESRTAALQATANAVTHTGRTFYLKPHPGEDPAVWQHLANTQIVKTDEALADITASAAVVLGYWSTLLMPLAAQPATVTYCLEQHPKPPGFSPGGFLIQEGVAEALETDADLAHRLTSPSALAAANTRQNTHKEEFLRQWLFALDGNATQRLCQVLRQ